MRKWTWQRLGSTIVIQDDNDREREEHRAYCIPDQALAQFITDACNEKEARDEAREEALAWDPALGDGSWRDTDGKIAP